MKESMVEWWCCRGKSLTEGRLENTEIRGYSKSSKEICDRKGFSITDEDGINRRLKVDSGWSAFSWGETLDIIVSQQTEGSTVTVDSKPNVWFNLTAENWAKRNIKYLFEELEKK